MTRSSRHKSHKQSKHSSKDAKDYVSDTEEDLKVKERSYSKDDEGRVSKESSHFALGEKRKLSSSFQSKEGKEGKDLSYSGNGDASDEYLSSKRRKEKGESIRGVVDRWTVVGDEKDDSGVMEKEKEKEKDMRRGESLGNDSGKGLKSRESKGSNDSKNKSSRRHESEVKREEKNVTSVLKVEEEENRSDNTRGESKRISEKDSGRREGRGSKETKEKERVSDRDSKKLQENKQESVLRVTVGSVAKSHDLLFKDADKDRPSKRAKENSELGIPDEFHSPEVEKEREKRICKKREGSDDGDCYRDAREFNNRDVSSKGDRAKDGRYKDERYRPGNHGEKYQDNKEKDDIYRDDKYREPVGGDRDSRRRDEKYRDDGERESKRREDRYRDIGGRDGKHRVDSERDVQLRDDNFSEDNDRENKHMDDKYVESAKHSRRASRYLEDGTRDDRLKDEKHREKIDRHKEEKSREDYQRDRELRDDRQRDDFDREKRARETRYRDDNYYRDPSGDKSDPKKLREETHSLDLHSRSLGIHDNITSYDDRARLKDAQGRKRTSDKDDYNDLRSRGFKDRRYDVDKRSTSDAGVDIATDKGRSGSRHADLETTSVRSKNQGSPGSTSHATRDQYRVSKQDELKYREYAYEERVRHGVTSTREYGSAVASTDKISSSRSSEKVIPRDDGLIGELSVDRRLKTDIRNSPRQLVDKSPSSTTADRRFLGRSDFRRSDDVEESGQRSVGFKDVKNYSSREGRGTRDLVSETRLGDEPSRGDADAISVSSPSVRNSHLSNSSKTFSHPPPPSFRGGIDSPQPFRSSEDDGRMKSNNRYRRNGDPNMVRLQGGPWKGLPNWPSPVPNGFVPFQHGPPIGFHHAMQQFPPAPSIMGLRPNMELNHPGVPFPIRDSDRFPLHGHHVGWRTPVYDPCPPPMHGWELNDAAIAAESQLSARQDWQHGRTLQGGGHPWEPVGDPWKGSKTVANIELPHAFEKDGNQSSHGPEYLTPPSQSSEQAKNEQSNRSAECFGTGHSSSDMVGMKIPVASTDVVEETLDLPKMSEKDDAQLCRVYLSKLDISVELTDPELYSRYKDIVNVDDKITSDSKDDQILYVEQQVVEAKEKNSTQMSSGSLFPSVNDSLLQKAMSLYKKRKEELVISCEKHAAPAASSVDIKGALQSYPEKQSHEAAVEVKSAVEELHPDIVAVKQSIGFEILEEVPCNPNQEVDKPSNEEISEDKNTSVMEHWGSGSKGQDCGGFTSSVPMETEESSSGCFPARADAIIAPPTDSSGNQGEEDKKEEEVLALTKNGSLDLSNVSSSSSKAHEIDDVPELASGSVNLNRIHHSPESTH